MSGLPNDDMVIGSLVLEISNGNFGNGSSRKGYTLGLKR